MTIEINAEDYSYFEAYYEWLVRYDSVGYVPLAIRMQEGDSAFKIFDELHKELQSVLADQSSKAKCLAAIEAKLAQHA